MVRIRNIAIIKINSWCWRNSMTNALASSSQLATSIVEGGIDSEKIVAKRGFDFIRPVFTMAASLRHSSTQYNCVYTGSATMTLCGINAAKVGQYYYNYFFLSPPSPRHLSAVQVYLRTSIWVKKLRCKPPRESFTQWGKVDSWAVSQFLSSSLRKKTYANKTLEWEMHFGWTFIHLQPL